MAELSKDQSSKVTLMGKHIDKKMKENPKLDPFVPSPWSSTVYEKDKRKPLADIGVEDLQALLAHTLPNPPWVIKEVREGVGLLHGPTGTMYYHIQFGQLFWAESFEEAIEKVRNKKIVRQTLVVK